MADTEQHLDIGRVLNNTFGVIMRNPLIFLGLSFLIVALPQALIQLATGMPMASDDATAMAGAAKADRKAKHKSKT